MLIQILLQIAQESLLPEVAQEITQQSVWVQLITEGGTVTALTIMLYAAYKVIKEKDKIIMDALEKKDKVIAVKDEQLLVQQKNLMELYGKAIEVQNRGNIIGEQLMDVIKETKGDINKLSDKIKV